MERQSYTFVELLCAIQSGDVTAVVNFLTKDYNQEIINQTYNSMGITPIQVACSLEEENNALLMVSLLLEYGADPKCSDKIGRTPLYIAAENGYYEVVKLLIEENVDVNIRLTPFETHIVPSTTTKFYMLEKLEMFPLSNYMGCTPLHQAVRNNHKQTVELLLINGADVNAVNDHKDTPILLAGANVKNKSIQDYEDIIRLLIKYKANLDVQNCYTGATALHNAIEIGSTNATRDLLEAGANITGDKQLQTPLHHAARKRNFEILSLLINYDKKNINTQDIGGKTPLHSAAFAGSRECTEILIQNGGNLSLKTKLNITVLDAIFKNVPRPVHLLKDILDKKITCNTSNYNSADFKLTFDFRIFSTSSSIKQMSIISAMIEAGKNCQISEIIQHPLTEVYLRLKWASLRIFFILLVMTYITYVLSLSVYSLLLLNNNKSTPFSITCVIEICRYIVLFSSFTLLVYSIVQGMLVSRNYIFQYEMWLNLICSILSFIVAFFNDINPPVWKIHIMSITILLSWMELMLLIGRFPTFGYYALMFSAVLQNVIKVLLTFICLVIGFTLSFCVQFHIQNTFDNPWKALVKTFVMMMGEYEYTDMFPADEESTVKSLPVTSRIIFLLFIIVASIVLMNLMTGLAVDDIQKLKVEGQVQRLIKQAVFLSHLETVLSYWIFSWKCVPFCISEYLHIKLLTPSIFQFKPGLNVQYDNLKDVLTFSTVESAVKIALDGKQENVDDKQLMTTILSILTDLQKEIKELKSKINN